LDFIFVAYPQRYLLCAFEMYFVNIRFIFLVSLIHLSYHPHFIIPVKFGRTWDRFRYSPSNLCSSLVLNKYNRSTRIHLKNKNHYIKQIYFYRNSFFFKRHKYGLINIFSFSWKHTNFSVPEFHHEFRTLFTAVKYIFH